MNAAMMNLLTTAPVLIDPPDDARAILLGALEAIRLERTARTVFEMEPGLERASLRLAWYVTRLPAHPSDDQPFLDRLLREALIAAVKAMKVPSTMTRAFLLRALSYGCRLLEMEIGYGRDRWDPLDSPPIGQWLRDHPQLFSRPLSDAAPALYAPRAFHAGLCLRIVEPADLPLVQAAVLKGHWVD